MLFQGNQGQIGKQTGQGLTVGLGETSEVLVTEIQGKYYENTYRNNTFVASTAAAGALSLTGTTTYTGLAVYNPANSGKNLVLKTAIFVPTIVATGVYAVMLFSQPFANALPAGATVIPVSANLGGGGASVARIATSATLAANPVFLRPLYGFGWITSVAQNAISYKDDIAGEIIVPPGSAVGFVALTTAITGLAYLSWDEVAI